MNDNELKQAFSVLAEGVDPEKIAEGVRAETEKTPMRPGGYERAERTNGRKRGIIALCCAAVVVLTSAVAAVPLLRNTLNTKSVREAARFTEVPEGWIGVYSLDDLDAVRNDLRGYYILMNDLVFEEEDFEDGGRFPGGWTPIGTRREPFCGIFDGNGHTIDGLTISVSPERFEEETDDGVRYSYLKSIHAGLFGYAASNSDLDMEFFGEILEEEFELDINGDGILDKVVVPTLPERSLLHFGDWGQSGTIRNLRLTHGSLRMVYPSRIYQLAETSNGNLYSADIPCAGPVAGYADYVLGCSVEDFTVTLVPDGDAEFEGNAVEVPVVREVLSLNAGGVTGQSYLIDSCFSGAQISVDLPANAPLGCEVNAGGLCGTATACVTSYFDGALECAGVTPGLCRIRRDDVPRFLNAGVIDEIMIRLLFVGVDSTGTRKIRPDNYEELTRTVRDWGVTADNIHEYMEQVRELSGNGRFDGFQAMKFLAFYTSDDPYYTDISPDAIQDHYTEEIGGAKNYILDPQTKPREYRELSNLISEAFPDDDFGDFCRENGVKYGMYYVYDLQSDPECSFEGFDFDSVWTWEGDLPVLRIFG